MSELKPCPFCGEPPSVTESGGVHCDNMQCPAIVGVPNMHFGKQDYSSASAWNNRSNKAEEMLAVLKAYEQWEADIILENECWSGQNLRLTDELYDRMIEIQTMRNAALSDESTR